MREILTSDADSWPGSWAHTDLVSIPARRPDPDTGKSAQCPFPNKGLFLPLSQAADGAVKFSQHDLGPQLQLLVRVWMEI